MSGQAFLKGSFSSGAVATQATGVSNSRVSSADDRDTQSQVLAAPILRPREGEPLRHILLGSPGNVRQTIHLLHTLRYVENALWSPLVATPENGLIITPRQGEVMSLLIRHMREQ